MIEPAVAKEDLGARWARDLAGWLSKDGIIEAVKAGEIKIQYYCLPTEDGVEQLPGDLYVEYEDKWSSELKRRVWCHFLSCLEEDSLKLSVGPYALVEGRSPWRKLGDFLGARRFTVIAGQPLVELLKHPVLRIFSLENVLIGTNEVLCVSDKVGGSLFALVRNTDVGLPHISTVIDPGWSGKLQIGVTNPTAVPKEVRLCEPLCKVRFHCWSRSVGETHASEKAHASDWSSLERDRTREFFPRRKGTGTTRQLNMRDLRQLGVTGTLLFLVATFLVQGLTAFNDWKRGASLASENEQRIEKLERERKRADSVLVRHDVREFRLEPGGESFSVGFPERLSKQPFILVDLQGAEGVRELAYSVVVPRKGMGKAVYFDSATITVRPGPAVAPGLLGTTVIAHTVILADWRTSK
jgi:hypothetical protein